MIELYSSHLFYIDAIHIYIMFILMIIELTTCLFLIIGLFIYGCCIYKEPVKSQDTYISYL